MDYVLIEAATSESLVNQVGLFLDSGWKPYGSPSVAVANVGRYDVQQPIFLQAMIKD